MPIFEPTFPGPEPDWGDLYEYAKELKNTLDGYKAQVAELLGHDSSMIEMLNDLAMQRDRYRQALEDIPILSRRMNDTSCAEDWYHAACQTARKALQP